MKYLSTCLLFLKMKIYMAYRHIIYIPTYFVEQLINYKLILTSYNTLKLKENSIFVRK